MTKSDPKKKQKNNEQCSVNLNDWSIHTAARENRVDVITKLLVEQGVDINARDEKGDTAAHIAAEANSSDTLHFLSENDAVLNVRNRFGWSPLHGACLNNSTDTLSFLFDKGLNIEDRDKYDCRPLHVAAMTNSVDSASFLIDHGAHIDAKDEDGETPLDYAIKNKNREITGYLLSKSADSEDRDFSWIGHDAESVALPPMGFRSRTTDVGSSRNDLRKDSIKRSEEEEK